MWAELPGHLYKSYVVNCYCFPTKSSSLVGIYSTNCIYTCVCTKTGSEFCSMTCKLHKPPKGKLPQDKVASIWMFYPLAVFDQKNKRDVFNMFNWKISFGHVHIILAYHFSPWKLERLTESCTCLWCQVLAELLRTSDRCKGMCPYETYEFMWSYSPPPKTNMSMGKPAVLI